MKLCLKFDGKKQKVAAPDTYKKFIEQVEKTFTNLPKEYKAEYLDEDKDYIIINSKDSYQMMLAQQSKSKCIICRISEEGKMVEDITKQDEEEDENLDQPNSEDQKPVTEQLSNFEKKPSLIGEEAAKVCAPQQETIGTPSPFRVYGWKHESNINQEERKEVPHHPSPPPREFQKALFVLPEEVNEQSGSHIHIPDSVLKSKAGSTSAPLSLHSKVVEFKAEPFQICNICRKTQISQYTVYLSSPISLCAQCNTRFEIKPKSVGIVKNQTR